MDLSMSLYSTLPRRSRKSKPKRAKLVVLFAAVLVLGAGAWFVFGRGQTTGTQKDSATTTSTKQEAKQTPAKLPLVNLQPVVDAWVAKQPAIDYGIVVYDPANKQVIASHNADMRFFAASLYKLFVAYLALEDFQKGTQDPNEVLINGFTRKQCVDKMIRESYTPCGEAMMASMGQDTLRQRVSAMGINNTIFAGITTTAQDAALILEDILEMRDLTPDNTAFLKNAMRIQDQMFRHGLAKGAPDATWETKVGWNDTYNYHDVGIMTLKSGRQYVVAILSYNNGSSAPIANFSATIYPVLK